MSKTEDPRISRAEAALRYAEKGVETAIDRMNDAAARLELAKKLPAEPKRGAVVKFQVQYEPGATVYSYMVHRAQNGQWYRTNYDGAMTWEDVMTLMERDHHARKAGVRYFVYGKTGTWVGRAE